MGAQNGEIIEPCAEVYLEHLEIAIGNTAGQPRGRLAEADLDVGTHVEAAQAGRCEHPAAVGRAVLVVDEHEVDELRFIDKEVGAFRGDGEALDVSFKLVADQHRVIG